MNQDTQTDPQAGISVVDYLIIVGCLLAGIWIGFAAAGMGDQVAGQHLIAQCERTHQRACELAAQPKE